MISLFTSGTFTGFSAGVNPGNTEPFATIDLTGDHHTYIRFHGDDDIDQLIAAACDAKRMLAAYTSGKKHPYAEQPGEPYGSCAVCGTLPADDIHQAPEPEPATPQQEGERSITLEPPPYMPAVLAADDARELCPAMRSVTGVERWCVHPVHDDPVHQDITGDTWTEVTA